MTLGPGLSDWTATEQGWKLTEEGLKAVPALIGALSDTRLSRAPDYPGHGDFALVKVRQVALMILYDISGQTFELAGPALLSDENVTAVQARAEAWLAGARRGDWANALEQELRSGKADVKEVAERLRRESPIRATAAVVAGYPKITDSGQREAAVIFLGSTPSAEGDALLKTVMVYDPSAGNRCTAAEELVARYPQEVTDAMIGEVNRSHAPTEHSFPESVLARTRKPRAFYFLRDHLKAFPPGGLVSLLTELGSDGIDSGYPAGIPDHHGSQPGSQELRDAVEDFAAAALSDTREAVGSPFPGKSAVGEYWVSLPGKGPRICDLAGHFLAAHESSGYRYHEEGSAQELEADRLYNLKLREWRRSNDRKTGS